MIEQIAKDYDINLINVDDSYLAATKMLKDNFINNSYAIGNKEIILGYYDDKELRIASFFHELGHCLDDENVYKNFAYNQPFVSNDSEDFFHKKHKSRFAMELAAWMIGAKEAAKYGITFSLSTLKWCYESLMTYEE